MLLALALGCNQYEMFRLAGYEQASFSNDADIVLITDNSPSMYDNSADLALNFNVFIEEMASSGTLPTGSVTSAVDAYIQYVSQRGTFLDYQIGMTTTSVDPTIEVPGSYGALVGGEPVLDGADPDNLELKFQKNLLCESTCWPDGQLPSDPNYVCDAENPTKPDQISLEYLDCVCGFDAWTDHCGSGNEEHLEAAVMNLCRSVEEPPDECFEEGLPFSEADIMTNAGMLREDSTVIFVVVTDEGDESRRLKQGDDDASPYLDILDAFGVRYRFVVIGPGYDPENNAFPCNSGGATTYGTKRLLQVAEETGGFFRPLEVEGAGGECENADFSEHLRELGELLNQLQSYFPLQSVPDTSTIIAYVDGVAVAESTGTGEDADGDGKEDYTDGWAYDPSTNAIQFYGSAIPDYNEDVEIYYRPLEGQPRTLPF